MERIIQIADKPTLDATKAVADNNAKKLSELSTDVTKCAGGGTKFSRSFEK